MKLLLYDIIPRLQPYVKAICSMDSQGPADRLCPFRVLPDTCVELFINYGRTDRATHVGNDIIQHPKSFVVSRMSRFMDVQSREMTGCITVWFYPGAASNFFEIPMSEIADSLTALEHLWVDKAAEIEERIAGATTNEERVSLLQHFLVKQLTDYGQ